MHYFLVKKL